MSALAQLFRAARETCGQFGADRMVILFGLPDSSRLAHLAAFAGVLPDLPRIAARPDAGVLICAK
eukprot:6052573-Alexandrium_andersonii.AAC.1